ncbi:MAG TPA: TetR-like C-terminal domain-containing protein [Actinomycetes bacterium]
MPRAGLSHDIVVHEAADVADVTGWEHLSLAAVAARFGVKLPSLYKHISWLDGLRRDVAVLATRELGATLSAAAVGRAGGDALRAVAEAYRGFGRAHPGRYAATVRSPAAGDGEHLAAAGSVLRVVLAVLAGYGLNGDDAVDATRAVRAGLHGFVTLEAGGGFGMPQDVDRSFRRMVDALDDTMTAWVSVG